MQTNFSLMAGLLFSAAALAAPLDGTAGSIVEVQVSGLNCALCSEAMRASLVKAVGATDIEPKLECGSIYLQIPKNATFNEGALGFTLQANGYNLKKVLVSDKTMRDIRTEKSC